MIVGLCGSIGNGKGSVADILVNKHGFMKESFANPVKDAVSIIFGWDRDLLEGETVQSRVYREQPDTYWSNAFNKEFTPRMALQLMGTEAGRDTFHPDLWIHALHKRCSPDKNYVIADVRFPNEIKSIMANGGKVYRIKRGENPKWYETALDSNLNNNPLMAEKYPEVHYSEWAWVGSELNGIIENNGTIEDLEKRVSYILNF